ncbi:MAG: hypothetical protein M5U08_03735 [Burkholderiales bacterium]|nr:hypothetical protein [Burkholderiales bacterium]
MTRRSSRCGCAALAACLLIGAPLATAADLGRLFFTPEQRAELDRRRNTNTVEAAEVVVESLLRVDGHVTRSSGKTTTWINGAPQYDLYRGRDPARVAVDDAAARTPVKVGETLDRTRGEIRPTIQPGSIEIHGGTSGRQTRAR